MKGQAVGLQARVACVLQQRRRLGLRNPELARQRPTAALVGHLQAQHHLGAWRQHAQLAHLGWAVEGKAVDAPRERLSMWLGILTGALKVIDRPATPRF